MEELNPVMGNVNFDCDEFIRLEILHLGGVDLGREQAFIKKQRETLKPQLFIEHRKKLDLHGR